VFLPRDHLYDIHQPGGARSQPGLEFPWFCGYVTACEGGTEDAKDKTAVSTIVELVRAGRSPEELAREFEPSSQSIRDWVKQAERDEGRRSDGLTTSEREELSRPGPDNRRLWEEREILAKAAAWFAREADAKKSSSS